MTRQPRVNEKGQKELDAAAEQISSFIEPLKTQSFDPNSPIEETEPQTKLSFKQASKADAPFIKPIRSIARTNHKTDKVDSRSYFREEHRPIHAKDWEYVRCIVENNEIIGEPVEVWTCKWGCDPAHFWRVPVNKPIMIPRLLAEQLSKCKYVTHVMADPRTENRFDMDTNTFSVDIVKARIDARPVGASFGSTF